MGPQIHELAIFFIKRTPFEFGFCVEKSYKILKLDNSGPIGRPPNMSKTAHNMGLQILIKEVHNYIAGRNIAGGPEICQTNFTST